MVSANFRLKTVWLLVLLSVSWLGATDTLTADADKPVAFWLTVLHNNDGESALLPRTVDDNGEQREYGGVARFAALVKQQKEEALSSAGDVQHAVVMLSSGDNFLAGPIFNVSQEKGVPYYDAIAMSRIGYDAICIGNHDFDFGPQGLADFIAGFPPDIPFLSANLDVSAEPELAALAQEKRIAASTVITQAGETIGIIGATTPQLPYISSPRQVQVTDVRSAVQTEIDKLERSGVNKIILISHLQDIKDDLALIPELRGVDIAIAGGGDELLANADTPLIPGDDKEIFGPYPIVAHDPDGREIPVITTSGSYRYLGKLVVGFDADGQIAMIDQARSGPLRIAGPGNPDAIAADAEVQAQISDPVTAAVENLAANSVGLSDVALDGRRIQVRSRETNQGNLIADAILWQAGALATDFGTSLPDVALQNGGGIRNDAIVDAGEITELDTFNMAPFSNFISIVQGVSRKQFKIILENAVSQVEDNAGRFAQIAGFSMVWDASGAAQQLNDAGEVVKPGSRIRSVTLANGAAIVKQGEVVAGPELSVATTDFLVRGGDQYPFADADFITLGVTYQQALKNYIVVALAGKISKKDYPEGGEGRHRRLN